MKEDNEDEAISWTVRPYKKAPWKRFAILGAAILAMAFGVFVYGQPLLGAVGFAIILGSTMDYWVGTSYRVDSKSATSKTGLSVTSILWSDVKRVVIGATEVKVSPLADGASKLDVFRGVVLKTNQENREQIVEAVRRFGGTDVRFLEG